MSSFKVSNLFFLSMFNHQIQGNGMISGKDYQQTVMIGPDLNANGEKKNAGYMENQNVPMMMQQVGAYPPNQEVHHDYSANAMYLPGSQYQVPYNGQVVYKPQVTYYPPPMQDKQGNIKKFPPTIPQYTDPNLPQMVEPMAYPMQQMMNPYFTQSMQYPNPYLAVQQQGAVTYPPHPMSIKRENGPGFDKATKKQACRSPVYLTGYNPVNARATDYPVQGAKQGTGKVCVSVIIIGAGNKFNDMEYVVASILCGMKAPSVPLYQAQQVQMQQMQMQQIQAQQAQYIQSLQQAQPAQPAPQAQQAQQAQPTPLTNQPMSHFVNGTTPAQSQVEQRIPPIPEPPESLINRYNTIPPVQRTFEKRKDAPEIPCINADSFFQANQQRARLVMKNVEAKDPTKTLNPSTEVSSVRHVEVPSAVAEADRVKAVVSDVKASEIPPIKEEPQVPQVQQVPQVPQVQQEPQAASNTESQEPQEPQATEENKDLEEETESEEEEEQPIVPPKDENEEEDNVPLISTSTKEE